MKKTIYIFSSGELSRKDNTIYFENDEGRRFIPVEDTGEIMIFGELDLNKKLLEFLSVKEITLHFSTITVITWVPSIARTPELRIYDPQTSEITWMKKSV